MGTVLIVEASDRAGLDHEFGERVSLFGAAIAPDDFVRLCEGGDFVYPRNNAVICSVRCGKVRPCHLGDAHFYLPLKSSCSEKTVVIR